MEPVYFPTAADFRAWLEAHHATATELLVGFHRKGSGVPSLTWPESVDEALCFGWIDGVRRSVDVTRYCIRFTPRKPRSTWSAVNVARVAELVREGRMRPAGLAAFERRAPERTGTYSYERRADAVFDPPLERHFRASSAAWDFFQAQPAGYRRLMTFWVMSAKQPATRERRLARLIEASAAGQRIQ
ncbi:MAG TPA: YdeI/OmpD-associated family protein [Gemmatimonadaceae bacterium]|nr:YdeI/OmpD-associated family protein [Gemmatimonadaceae bacterium]